jgi:uncharacterized membrane protein
MQREERLAWQSKLVLLLTMPFIGAGLALQLPWWAAAFPVLAATVVGLSILLGAAAWLTRSATAWAALTGAVIAASVALSTLQNSADLSRYGWMRIGYTALTPLTALILITSLATRFRRSRKEALGLAEARHGRTSAQVAANLGIAALAALPATLMALENAGWLRLSSSKLHGLHGLFWSTGLCFAPALAALAESAADTVSSEIGQVLGGAPRLLTTLQRVAPGTNGAVSLMGSLAGIAAAAFIAALGAWPLAGGWEFFGITLAAGAFGLFFDSLLGATLERRGWLNNNAVNFLSTLSAAAMALLLLARLPIGG